jgi:tetratricopeptide (TPR) repeat protein
MSFPLVGSSDLSDWEGFLERQVNNFMAIISRSALIFCNHSSGSLSLLPAHPKIFHGRESELKDLIDALLHDPARVAILGPGGMGKTTLAMAALHHPAIWEKYNLKHFISCESASTCGDLVASIGLHLGLEPSRQLSKAIVRHLGQCGPCLVVLDNFETPWESIESRAQVEEFISLLADIPSFALLVSLIMKLLPLTELSSQVTMRGAERPGKVKWNRPFLPPLEPLSPSASRQIFIEVADEPESGEQSALNDLLELSGSLPLAVSLMANIASFEGYSSTLTRWETENTALLSEGHDKRSNLEKSISLSLRSPRISSSPDAKNLISLLSLLPDGIRPEDIFTSKVPIPNARQCQSVLIGTSLAYLDVKGRLKALSPVREYIRRAYPPSVSLVRPLRTYFQNLLEVWESNRELPSGDLVPDLISHLGNINQLILAGILAEGKATWIELGKSIITLDFFSTLMLKGGSPLFKRLPRLIEEANDAALRWKYRRIILRNAYYHLIQDHDIMIEEGVQYFNAGRAPVGEGKIILSLIYLALIARNPAVKFYNAVAYYYIMPKYRNISKATEFNKWAFTLAAEADDIDLQLEALDTAQQLATHAYNSHWIIEVVHKARSIAGFRSTGHWESSWLIDEAWAHLWMGDLRRALDLCMQAEDSLMPGGMGGSERYLEILDLRADVLWLKTEYLEARRVFAQMAQKTSPTRSIGYHAHALCGMVEMDILMEGETADVLSNLNAAKAIYIAVDSPRIVWCSAVAAKINLLRGDTENARVAFLKCLSKSRGIFPDIVRDSLAALADPRHKMHGPMDSFRWAMVYFASAQKANKPADRLDALQRLADIYLLMGDDETALHLFQAALEGGTKMGIHRLRAECMARIGDIMLRRRDTMSAMDMWEAAHPLFIRSSCRKDAALVEERIQKLSQSLLAIRDGTGETSTTSAQVVLPSALKQLEALSAPNTSLSLQLETDDDPGTSPDEKTELFAL